MIEVGLVRPVTERHLGSPDRHFVQTVFSHSLRRTPHPVAFAKSGVPDFARLFADIGNSRCRWATTLSLKGRGFVPAPHC
jgi:hypothetical protein